MCVVIIGGTGHIGTYLTPRLVSKGHEVIVVSRGQRRPYQAGPAWARVQMVEIDRCDFPDVEFVELRTWDNERELIGIRR